jgi:hypothetical protein
VRWPVVEQLHPQTTLSRPRKCRPHRPAQPVQPVRNQQTVVRRPIVVLTRAAAARTVVRRAVAGQRRERVVQPVAAVPRVVRRVVAAPKVELQVAAVPRVVRRAQLAQRALVVQLPRRWARGNRELLADAGQAPAATDRQN